MLFINADTIALVPLRQYGSEAESDHNSEVENSALCAEEKNIRRYFHRKIFCIARQHEDSLVGYLIIQSRSWFGVEFCNEVVLTVITFCLGSSLQRFLDRSQKGKNMIMMSEWWDRSIFDAFWGELHFDQSCPTSTWRIWSSDNWTFDPNISWPYIKVGKCNSVESFIDIVKL